MFDYDSIGPVAGVLYLIFVVILVAAEWKVFVKAGKPGWAAIVPIYNIIIMLEIVGKPWWWLILLLIPFVNIVIIIMIMHRLSLSFGQGVGFTLGLLFLGFIFLPVLGFGSSKYVGPPA